MLLGTGTVVTGCARPSSKETAPPRSDVTTISAENTRFQILPSGRDRRAGLHAITEVARSDLYTAAQLFEWAASDDGIEQAKKNGAFLRKPYAGDTVTLVGKLPDVTRVGGTPAACTDYDKFSSEDGSIKSGAINVSARFIRWKGLTKHLPGPCAAYLLIMLPPLPAGKYRARIVIKDYACRGDSSKIFRPKSSEPPLPTFKPLTCDFEVREVEE
jgi:hypothetical protein